MKRSKLYASLLRHLFLNLHEIRGQFEGNKLRILVADDGTTLDYIAQLAFPKGGDVSQITKISAFRCPDLARSRADIVVVGANLLLTNHYLQNGFRIVPKWLKMIMPVKEDQLEWLSSFGRTSKRYFSRKIKNTEDSGFKCEVTRDASAFSEFYYQMYKPYAHHRFEGNAVVYKPEVLEKFFNRGFLVISKRNGQPVAGIMAYQTGETLHMPFGGIARGDVELVKEGAMFAVQYHIATNAHSWGCNLLDWGRSRPFLSDGTLQYKLSWHASPVPCDDVANFFAVTTPGLTPQAEKFMEANPYFYLAEDECRRSDESVAEPIAYPGTVTAAERA